MAKGKSAYDFNFTSIEGKPMPLSAYKGKAVLVVNTASECGLTPQYKGLEELWTRYKGKGLVVIGVPSNDFGAQEPGTEGEIKTFCETRYGVDFPLTNKQSVIGASAHPFYKWVTEQLGEDAAPKWNFHKYLIAPDGALAGTFGSRTAPDDAALNKAIDEALPAT
jgi:glutathione peroxidase